MRVAPMLSRSEPSLVCFYSQRFFRHDTDAVTVATKVLLSVLHICKSNQFQSQSFQMYLWTYISWNNLLFCRLEDNWSQSMRLHASFEYAQQRPTLARVWPDRNYAQFIGDQSLQPVLFSRFWIGLHKRCAQEWTDFVRSATLVWCANLTVWAKASCKIDQRHFRFFCSSCSDCYWIGYFWAVFGFSTSISRCSQLFWF